MGQILVQRLCRCNSDMFHFRQNVTISLRLFLRSIEERPIRESKLLCSKDIRLLQHSDEAMRGNVLLHASPGLSAKMGTQHLHSQGYPSRDRM
jgi:hypothetical protein